MGFRNIAILSVFAVITAQMATADICDDKCKYGGTCTPTQQGSSFHCDCTPGRCGNKCNQDFSSCKGKRKDCCQNNGSCVQDGDTPSCVCTTGWTGAFCELVDYCASNPCLNDATCNNELEGYTCTCAAGFTGVNCETKCPTEVVISPAAGPVPVGTEFSCSASSDPASTCTCVLNDASGVEIGSGLTVTISTLGTFTLTCTASLEIEGVEQCRATKTITVQSECAYGETGQTAPAPPCNSKCCVRVQAERGTPPKYFMTAKPGNVETVLTCDYQHCVLLLDVENCNAMKTAGDADTDVVYSIRDDWNANNVNKLVFWSSSQHRWMEVTILPEGGGDLIEIIYGQYTEVSLCATGYNGGPLQVTDVVKVK